MTRAEVKAQLAKSPLEWKEEAGLGFKAYSSLKFTIASCHAYYIAMVYNSKDIASYLDFIGLNDERIYSVEEVLSSSPNKSSSEEDRLKAMAEEHRLDLVCRMLGVKE